MEGSWGPGRTLQKKRETLIEQQPHGRQGLGSFLIFQGLMILLLLDIIPQFPLWDSQPFIGGPSASSVFSHRPRVRVTSSASLILTSHLRLVN